MHEQARLYSTFRLDGRLFGVPAADVKEVTLETRFSPIPHTPKAILGYLNLRGLLFLALDARTLLGLSESRRIGDRPHLLLFREQVGESFGIVVDEIGEIVGLTAEQHDQRWDLPTATTGDANGARLVTGIGKLDDELVVLIEPRAILPAVQRALSALLEPSEPTNDEEGAHADSTLGAVP